MEWLNGLKSFLGMSLVALAPHIPDTVLTPFIEVPVQIVTYIVGGGLTGVGVTHKYKKGELPGQKKGAQ